MPISMYQASAPRFANMLRNLAALIEKADAHCAAKKIDPAALTAFRLYPDMFAFTRQVQIACGSIFFAAQCASAFSMSVARLRSMLAKRGAEA